MYPLADMSTIIRNALLVKKPEVKVPYSKLKFEVAKILEQEGYLAGFSKDRTEEHEVLVLKLKYYNDQSVIQEIQVVSKPGQRIHSGADSFPSILGGLGTLIISTSKGLLTSRQAKKQKVGGEVLIKVW